MGRQVIAQVYWQFSNRALVARGRKSLGWNELGHASQTWENHRRKKSLRFHVLGAGYPDYFLIAVTRHSPIERIKFTNLYIRRNLTQRTYVHSAGKISDPTYA